MGKRNGCLSRKKSGGFWNNELASESEITKSGRRVHRTRSYRKARRESSHKKWKSRAWKAALGAAALGTAYAVHKNRDAIAEGLGTAKERATGLYDQATGTVGDHIARYRGQPTRAEILAEAEKANQGYGAYTRRATQALGNAATSGLDYASKAGVATRDAVGRYVDARRQAYAGIDTPQVPPEQVITMGDRWDSVKQTGYALGKAGKSGLDYVSNAGIAAKDAAGRYVEAKRNAYVNMNGPPLEDDAL